MEGVLILAALAVVYFLVFRTREDKSTTEWISKLSDEHLCQEYIRHINQQGGYKTNGRHVKDMSISKSFEQEMKRREI